MNILMLLFKDIHLDARVQREAIALAEAGYHVDIACLYEREDEPKPIHPNVRFIRIQLTTKRIKRSIQDTSSKKYTPKLIKLFRTPIVKLLKDIYAQYEYRQKVNQLLRSKQYQVVHCHDLNTLPTGIYLQRKHPLKVVYDSHELFNEMVGKSRLESWVGYKIEKKLIRKIDHLITVNPYAQQFFFDRYGEMPATVIQNTPLWTFDSIPDIRNYWREIYQLEPQDMILLYQGGITPQRGIEECIDALRYLPERYKLILLGEGSLLQKIKLKVHDENLSDRVYFHSPVLPSEILGLTAQADIGLVMYKNTCLNNYLSTPNKIFEYFMAGIPTVASNHPGKRYIVEEVGTGVCVEETPIGISKGILKVTEEYEKYRTNCLTRRSEFTWDVEKKKLVEMYQGLVKS